MDRIVVMRAVTLLICVGMAGCAATEPGNEAVLNTMSATRTTAMAPAPTAIPPAELPVVQAAAAMPLVPSPAPPPAVAGVPVPEPTTPAPIPAAARAASPPPRPAQPPPEPQEPMTHERASAICWMKYEDGRRNLSLDQRADLVDKCVKATLSGAPPK